MGAPSAPRMITWGAAGSPQTPRLRALLWGVAVLLHIAPHGAGVAKRAQPCAKRPTPFPAKKRMGKTGAKRQAAVLSSVWGTGAGTRPGAWALPGHALIGPRQTSGRAGGPGRCPSPQRKNCHDQAESEAIFASRASCASGPRSLASREAPLPASLLPCFAGFFIPLAVCWLCRQTGPVAMTARRYPASRLGLAVGKEAAGHAP